MTRNSGMVLAACVFSGVAGALLGASGGALEGAWLAAVLAVAAALAALALGSGPRAKRADAPPEEAGEREEAPAERRKTLRTAFPGRPGADRDGGAGEAGVAPDLSPEMRTLRGRLDEEIERMRRLQELSEVLTRNLAELASKVAAVAVQNARLLESAERDGAQVGEEIQALVGIKEALHQGTEVIDDLARSSREVGPVIESIFVVARKTNMLALNAAIEAARAGEQGRGFAVVAEEVRRLAEAATASTQKVERFVEGLRERTASAIQVLQGTSRIEETIPVVYRISDAFVSLIPAVEAANRSLGDLSKLVEDNMREAGSLREAAQAGLAATTESVARLDALMGREAAWS